MTRSSASSRLQQQLAKRLETALEDVAQRPSLVVSGLLRRTVGLTLEAEGCSAPVGTQCDVIGNDGHRVSAEVVGFAGDRLFLMPTTNVHGVAPTARVIPISARELALRYAVASTPTSTHRRSILCNVSRFPSHWTSVFERSMHCCRSVEDNDLVCSLAVV